MKQYIGERKLRRKICDIGQKLYDKGFVVGNDGNISVRINETEILVTPTGISKGYMKPKCLVKMDLDGNIIGGKSKPSTEVKMHIKAYQLNPNINAVVHAHPPISTAFAVARVPMERPVLAESVINIGIVPVANFAFPGTQGVPDSIIPYVKDYNAVLLANHGLLTWGNDLKQAYFRLESVEQFGRILMLLKQIGTPYEFNAQEIDELMKIRKGLGIESGGIPRSGLEKGK
ncbi:MAG: class II aldolase/adducin family protein [Clostridiales bacterium]|nr:class II aldolase/adducin family protein [Clostridiales bacterium]